MSEAMQFSGAFETFRGREPERDALLLDLASAASAGITPVMALCRVPFKEKAVNPRQLDVFESALYIAFGQMLEHESLSLISDDEENIWQSNTIVLDGGATGLVAFPANMDYGLTMSTVEPTTKASLAPVGANAAGVYYAQTVNVVKENGAPAINLNGGFDVGRGSEVLSLSGKKGVANPNTLLGNQDPTAAGKTPTLGFATWDNGGDGNGSVRLGWLSVDLIALSPTPAKPSSDVGVIKPFFGIRIPVVTAGILQGITKTSFGLFGTKTSLVAWPDPDGFAVGAFGVAPVASASNQFPTTGLTVCPVVISLPVNITYGTSGRKDGPGGLTYNPAIADTSGTRELFLFD